MNELLLMCTIAGRRAAITAIEVQSVIEVEKITPIPGTPDFILGLTALRSQALTVIDCRRAIGFDPDSYPLDHRAIVASSDGYAYALRIDAIAAAARSAAALRSERRCVSMRDGVSTRWLASAPSAVLCVSAFRR